ncbi:MAG: hypothetical protein HYW89_04280 [Candidatus Sungiibacteriota bacterium]|uniref:Transcription regulator TrmB N-terminal domain-containing protein n=1 Tax=Candidatus Sungiibacteriota bacterium TaxID=2750080 RepID=A0A7T5UR71_9BACT|nr:MAG: hypothetical protein HYW89_04280 [Candidatus Sungbacteria bacterium]
MRKILLQPLGLDKKTEALYRALLSLADAPAGHIARRAGIKRTSAYHILENLISMGLVSSYQERGVRRFVAEHPTKLKTFFERQAILAERLIPELEKELRRLPTTPHIRFFEGQDAVRSMTEEALRSKEKLIQSIGSTKKLLELIGGKYGFGERRRERGIFLNSLRFPDDEKSDSGIKLHENRILPESFNFPGYVFIFGNSVGIIPFEKPVRGMLITDRPYATMMKSIFITLWGNVAA